MQESNIGRRSWVEVDRGKVGRLYASVNSLGHISVSGWTHERLGGPSHYVLMFDRRTRAVGLRAATEREMSSAFLAGITAGKGNKNKRIRARAFLRDAGLLPENTVKFDAPRIERGVLVLEFGEVKR